jgi:hypothetical protein
MPNPGARLSHSLCVCARSRTTYALFSRLPSPSHSVSLATVRAVDERRGERAMLIVNSRNRGCRRATYFKVLVPRYFPRPLSGDELSTLLRYVSSSTRVRVRIIRAMPHDSKALALFFSFSAGSERTNETDVRERPFSLSLSLPPSLPVRLPRLRARLRKGTMYRCFLRARAHSTAISLLFLLIRLRSRFIGRF